MFDHDETETAAGVTADRETRAVPAEVAAAIIRPHWDDAASPMSPEEQHAAIYLAKVCKHLGVEANTVNVAHAVMLMNKMGIARYTGDEYPKALNTTDRLGRTVAEVYPMGHPKAGLPVVFATPEEEAEWGKEKHEPDHEHDEVPDAPSRAKPQGRSTSGRFE